MVFEVLDELGVRPDIIAGSSIGALIGMGYAAGMTGRELRSNVLETFSDSKKVLRQFWSLRPTSFQDWFKPETYSLGQIDPQKILSLFTPITNLPEYLEDLQTPLRVITTDFYSWEDAVFTQGRLIEVVAASIAIPFVFRPVRINGRIMVDGNITNPLPFEHLPDDLEHIIAVDVVGGPDHGGTKVPSGFEAMLGSNQIMMQAITREKLEKHTAPDLLIRPPIDKFAVLDFLKASIILRTTDTMRDDIKRDIDQLLC